MFSADLIIEAMPHKTSGFAVTGAEVGPSEFALTGDNKPTVSVLPLTRAETFRDRKAKCGFTVTRAATIIPHALLSKFSHNERVPLASSPIHEHQARHGLSMFGNPVRSPTSLDVVHSKMDISGIAPSGLNSSGEYVRFRPFPGEDVDKSHHDRPASKSKRTTPHMIRVSSVEDKLAVEEKEVPHYTHAGEDIERFKPKCKTLGISTQMSHFDHETVDNAADKHSSVVFQDSTDKPHSRYNVFTPGHEKHRRSMPNKSLDLRINIQKIDDDVELIPTPDACSGHSTEMDVTLPEIPTPNYDFHHGPYERIVSPVTA